MWKRLQEKLRDVQPVPAVGLVGFVRDASACCPCHEHPNQFLHLAQIKGRLVVTCNAPTDEAHNIDDIMQVWGVAPQEYTKIHDEEDGNAPSSASLDLGDSAPLWPDAEKPMKSIVEELKKKLIEQEESEALGIVPDEDVPNDTVEWAMSLDVTRQGAIRSTLKNMLAVVENAWAFRGRIKHNDFTQRVEVAAKMPWDKKGAKYPRQWTDLDDNELRCWVETVVGYSPAKDMVVDAVMTVASRNSYNPLQDYLKRCAKLWDGKKRISSWLHTYLGAQHDAPTSAMGRAWLISAVARAMCPGEKVDTILILEGGQGIGKSTALRNLCPRDNWFVEDLADLDSGRVEEQILGKWLCEVAEMDKLSRADDTRVKAFLSQRQATIRLPYARRSIDALRTCVFAATINPAANNKYLKDETGGRRYWMVRCGIAFTPSWDLITSITEDRDQLWGEAVAAWEGGEKWVLPESVAKEVKDMQSDRTVEDEWHGAIETFINEKTFVTLDDIYTNVLQMSLRDRDHRSMTRIVRVLTKLGWQDGRKSVDGERKRGFVPQKREKA